LSQTSRINDRAARQANLLIPINLISDQALRKFNGSAADRNYYAVCTRKIVDCIDPNLSIAQQLGGNKDTSFSNNIVKIDLNSVVCREFENNGNCKYEAYDVSYNSIGSIKLMSISDLSELNWFQAEFLPGYTFASPSFVNDLKVICRAIGFYDCFWDFSIDRVRWSYLDERRADR
jgi:hypothetical protein